MRGLLTLYKIWSQSSELVYSFIAFAFILALTLYVSDPSRPLEPFGTCLLLSVKQVACRKGVTLIHIALGCITSALLRGHA